jgi:hypothetical protein
VYDKAEVKYLERVLDERDYATADTADEIVTGSHLHVRKQKLMRQQ